jgi:hypothetical protein
MFVVWTLGIGIKKTHLDIKRTANIKVFSIKKHVGTSETFR